MNLSPKLQTLVGQTNTAAMSGDDLQKVLRNLHVTHSDLSYDEREQFATALREKHSSITKMDTLRTQTNNHKTELDSIASQFACLPAGTLQKSLAVMPTSHAHLTDRERKYVAHAAERIRQERSGGPFALAYQSPTLTPSLSI